MTQALFASSGAPILTESSSSSAKAPAARSGFARLLLGGLPLAQELGQGFELLAELVQPAPPSRASSRGRGSAAGSPGPLPGGDQKSGADAFSLRPSSALRAASRSKIAPKRPKTLRGGPRRGRRSSRSVMEEALSGQLSAVGGGVRRTAPEPGAETSTASAGDGIGEAAGTQNPQRVQIVRPSRRADAAAADDRRLVRDRAPPGSGPSRPRSRRCP